MKSRVIIWGAGGHAKVVADGVRLLGAEILGFVEEINSERVGGEHYGSVVISLKEAMAELEKGRGSVGVCLGVGDNAGRSRIVDYLSGFGIVPEIVIHPKAIISPSAKIESGAVVMAGAIIQADSMIEKGSIINTGSSIDHDCRIGALSHICPGTHLAGGVSVGERSFIGAGSVVREGIKIGSDVIAGAGSVIVKDISDACRIMGNPAR
ncbi:MAG TPA: acetyltransferase [Oligoflexia bacterium]|nr:acetyltransferase [Oligoflexia bacterium]HMP48944.1 acetyltransferase [Oligoflexia bacterium]